MEIVASVNKIMKHPKKIHFTRSTKAKSFNNRKNNVSVKSNRFHRSNSLRNSLKLNKNKSQEEIINFINNNGTENKPFSRSYTPNLRENSLKHNSQELNNFITIKGADNERVEKAFLGEFAR